jgi:N-acylglucosamine-6-phosphate 2-epimerase
MFDPGIIVSCQPRVGGDFLFDAPKFAAEAQVGGAVAVRVEGVNNVRNTRAVTTIPVIGIFKTYEDGFVKITATYNQACDLIGHGADYIAADATGRWGWEQLMRMTNCFPTIGDIDTFENAKIAQSLGCIAVTTALSGYTLDPKAQPFDPPDIDLIQECVEGLSIPVIAEGRIWTQEHLQKVKDAGAYGACIGGAITDVAKITKFWALEWGKK